MKSDPQGQGVPMRMRKTLGYLALGSALWRGVRWYRGRRDSRRQWQSPTGSSYLTGGGRDFGDDIDLRTGAEESVGLRRESWE